MNELLNVVLVSMVLLLAFGTIVARDVYGAVASFLAYGLLLTLIWLRVYAVDVAMTEAAIGAGLTGALLIGAGAHLGIHQEADAADRPGIGTHLLAALAAAAVAAVIGTCVLLLPEPPPTLAPLVADNMPALEVGNPITAVLLGFRAIDTLLEAIVLLIALIGVWSLAPDRFWGGRPGDAVVLEPDGVLAYLGRVLVPIGILVALYILWAGADFPGGKFQGATVLAAMWLLVMMAGLSDAPRIGTGWLRIGLAAGPLVFIGIGTAGVFATGAFLGYPDGWAKPWILAIEFALMPSLAMTLALLFSGPPRR